MQTQTPCGSAAKASTPIFQMLGGALIAYQVKRNQESRDNLEALANEAMRSGFLTTGDQLVLEELLAKPCRPRRLQIITRSTP
ncbi:hypothetical protein QYE80_16690 [Pseudomonas tohonis]|uniref:hypothetical protein n=1 Tax=Pseudomonas solani TaxID=2731552 RepID=UPI00146BB083|nr:hypothetical protein [Pseudomonas tohonis]